MKNKNKTAQIQNSLKFIVESVHYLKPWSLYWFLWVVYFMPEMIIDQVGNCTNTSAELSAYTIKWKRVQRGSIDGCGVAQCSAPACWTAGTGSIPVRLSTLGVSWRNLLPTAAGDLARKDTQKMKNFTREQYCEESHEYIKNKHITNIYGGTCPYHSGFSSTVDTRNSITFWILCNLLLLLTFCHVCLLVKKTQRLKQEWQKSPAATRQTYGKN